jgi:adenylate cyclase
MSGDPEQEYFADGMVEEIITALSRMRWLFVIARNSSFTYKGRPIDVKQVSRELGVRYVLEGSVRKAARRVRITAQLIEAESGAHLWADRFDGSLVDVFELQDKVALSVAGVIEPTLLAAEVQRSARRPVNHLGAYDLYLRAYAMMLSPARRVAEVAGLLDQAIASDPDFGPALGLAAAFHMNSHIFGWCEDPEDNRRKGLERAAGLASGRGRSDRARQCRRFARLFRRGHRRHDRAGRPGAGAQPELRAGLARQWLSQALGGPA